MGCTGATTCHKHTTLSITRLSVRSRLSVTNNVTWAPLKISSTTPLCVLIFALAIGFTYSPTLWNLEIRLNHQLAILKYTNAIWKNWSHRVCAWRLVTYSGEPSIMLAVCIRFFPKSHRAGYGSAVCMCITHYQWIGSFHVSVKVYYLPSNVNKLNCSMSIYHIRSSVQKIEPLVII